MENFVKLFINVLLDGKRVLKVPDLLLWLCQHPVNLRPFSSRSQRNQLWQRASFWQWRSSRDLSSPMWDGQHFWCLFNQDFTVWWWSAWLLENPKKQNKRKKSWNKVDKIWFPFFSLNPKSRIKKEKSWKNNKVDKKAQKFSFLHPENVEKYDGEIRWGRENLSSWNWTGFWRFFMRFWFFLYFWGVSWEIRWDVMSF